eukprot:scaffold3230_cov94-Skeletonema_dohrnii-CCMP3373.AAC.2
MDVAAAVGDSRRLVVSVSAYCCRICIYDRARWSNDAITCNRDRDFLVLVHPSSSHGIRSSRITLQTDGHVVKAEECYEEAE